MSESSARRQPGLWAFGEQVVYESPEILLGRIDAGLANGERAWRHVVHLQRVALMVLVDDLDRVLLLWRRRFTPPRWGWELPGGVVGQDELASEAAARELEDQTGYRAGRARHLITFQPFADSVDGEHVVFAGRGTERTGDAVSLDGIDRVEWVPLASLPGLIAAGQIWNGGSLVGLQQVLTQR